MFVGEEKEEEDGCDDDVWFCFDVMMDEENRISQGYWCGESTMHVERMCAAAMVALM
jgi:hypothetical protein